MDYFDGQIKTTKECEILIEKVEFFVLKNSLPGSIIISLEIGVALSTFGGGYGGTMGGDEDFGEPDNGFSGVVAPDSRSVAAFGNWFGTLD